MTPEEFDFLLIRQKEKILTLINNNRIREALYCLNLVKELWLNMNISTNMKKSMERIRKHKMGNQTRLPDNSTNQQPIIT
jgi:hypothetical protein